MDDYILQPGDRLGDCVIIAPIGKGGFAEVYLADCKRQGEVALKLFTNPEFDYMDFFNEVVAMGLFNHKPYFVAFLGASGISSHFQYILIEYMRGGTLRERIKKIRLNEALWIVYIISYALRDMHDSNLVHRDVAPDNIFFDESDNPKLGDLGLAATPDQLQKLPFKRYYTAPEIFEGQNYSYASDVYSLGVTLYEMLGGNPGKGNIYDGIKDFEVPLHVREVLERMCSKDPEERCFTPHLIEILSPHISPEIFTAYTVTESQKPFFDDIEEVLGKSWFHQEREKSFLRIWMEKKESIFEGLNEELKMIIKRAIYFSSIPLFSGERWKKRSNCYLGLEHLLWVLLERETLLHSLLEKCRFPVEQVKKEIFGYLSRIEYNPVLKVVSPRLEDILKKAKNEFPQGVGQKEFIGILLREETFFSHILRTKGLDPQVIRNELKR